MARQRQRPQQQRRQQQEQRQRILRIGIILGGKIIEERLVRTRSDVTIGQSAKNSFSVPVEGLPKSWPLFTVHDNQYYLQFSDAMDGRVSDGQGVHSLDTLKQGTAQRRGSEWVMLLPESSRGKITLGEMTLLFQFVTEPPRQPRPHLPASVRGTFADRIDPQLSVILAISIIIHFGIALYAYQRDRADPFATRSAKVYKDSFERPTVAIDETLFEPDKTTEDGDTAKKDDKSEDKKETAKKDTPKKDDTKSGGDNKKENTGGGGSEEDNVKAREEVVAYVDGIFSESTALSGDTGDVDGRSPDADLAKQIEHAKDSNAKVEAGGGDSGRGVRDGRDAEAGTGKGPNVGGKDTEVKTTTKTTEKAPGSRISPTRPSGDSSFLDPNKVLSRIKSVYMSGLKRCHKKLLKKDPTAGGKVKLKFRIGPSGRVTKAKVSGFESGVDSCIQKLVMGWRFAVPKDEDGEPTDADFSLTLALQAT